VWALVSFSLCSAMGQCFIYYTIAEFSPLLLATVTTTRKIFSTLVSVFRDPSEMIYIYICMYVYIM
jgi:solute carrier family 35 (UDP-galactose transporter), member B1